MIAKLWPGMNSPSNGVELVVADPTTGTVVAILEPRRDPGDAACACTAAPLWRGLKQRWMQPASCCA